MAKPTLALSVAKQLIAKKEFTEDQILATFDLEDDRPSGSIATRARGNLARMAKGEDIPVDGLRPDAKEQGARGLLGKAVGAGKGVISSALETAQLAGDYFEPPVVSATRRAARMATPPTELEEALEPTGPDEKTGHRVERVAEIVGGPAKAATVFVGKKLAPRLAKGAVESVARALSPTTKPNKALTTKIAPDLVARGVVAATRDSLATKVGKRIEEAAEQLDTAWGNVPDGTRLPVDKVIKSIERAKRSVFYKGETKQVIEAVESPILGADGKKIITQVSKDVTPEGLKTPAVGSFAATLGQLKKVLSDVADDKGTIDVRRLKDLRQTWDEVAAKANGYSGQSMSEIEKGAANAHRHAATYIRSELAKEFPSIAKINKEYTFWRRAGKVINDTITRTTGQSQRVGEQGMGMAGVAGGLAQGSVRLAIVYGATAKLLRKATTSTGWNLVSAQVKDKLAKSLANGNVSEVNAILAGIASARVTQKLGEAKASQPVETQQ